LIALGIEFAPRFLQYGELMNPVRVLVADDESLLRHALRAFLSADDRVVLVGEAEDGAQAVSACVNLSPDVILMDVKMPGLGGVEATRQITSAGLPCRVLALTTFTTEWRALEILRAGATGYLIKDTTPEELVDAILAAHAGDRVVSPEMQTAFVRQMMATDRNDAPTVTIVEELSPRQLQIVELIAEGMSNAEIARRLCFSEATVKSEINQINRTWGVSNRLQIALHAATAGLVEI